MSENIEVITWKDATSEYGWREPDEIEIKPAINKSAGFLVKENDDGVIIAMDYCPADGDYNSTGYIPKSLIISRVTMRAAVP